MPIEDVIEMMKKNIQITPVVNPATRAARDRIPAFAVQFSYENRLAGAACGAGPGEPVHRREHPQPLAMRCIRPPQFMKDELDQAKKELDESENKLAAFRMQNNGRLPDQVDGNMRQLSALAVAGELSEFLRSAGPLRKRCSLNRTHGFIKTK